MSYPAITTAVLAFLKVSPSSYSFEIDGKTTKLIWHAPTLQPTEAAIEEVAKSEAFKKWHALRGGNPDQAARKRQKLLDWLTSDDRTAIVLRALFRHLPATIKWEVLADLQAGTDD